MNGFLRGWHHKQLCKNRSRDLGHGHEVINLVSRLLSNSARMGAQLLFLNLLQGPALTTLNIKTLGCR